MKVLLCNVIIFIVVCCADIEPTPIIAIDLGNTFSTVGVIRDGAVEIVSDENGNQLIPSVIFFGDNNNISFGKVGKNMFNSNRNNTVFDLKRLLGKFYDDKFVQDNMKIWPFQIIDVNNNPKIEIKIGSELKHFSVEEITSMLIRKLKKMAEFSLGQEVKNAIITVSTYFNNNQRVSIKEAVNLAGLNVVRMIKEPIAASMAHQIDKKEDNKTILVFHLGGSTFDVTLLTFESNVFEIVANCNNLSLGGRNFNERVVSHLMTTYNQRIGPTDPNIVELLYLEAEKAKIVLSTETETIIRINDNFEETLTRSQFEDLNFDLFQEMIESVSKVLEDTFLNKTDIHEIILVGGSTRTPIIRKMLIKYFDGKKPMLGVQPDLAFVHGATLKTQSIAENEKKTVSFGRRQREMHYIQMMQWATQMIVEKVFSIQSRQRDEFR